MASPIRRPAVKALNAAAEECKKLYGSLDVAWGDVYRYRERQCRSAGRRRQRAPRRFPHHRLRQERSATRITLRTARRSSARIEFAEKQNAQCALSYGNFSQPGSKHLEDQLPLMVEKKLHPVWRDRKEIEANLEKRESFK